jgi:hypothetical protein
MALIDEVLNEEIVSPIEDMEEVTQPVAQEEELPEKYRGKTAKEIAKMHEEAEKLISRQGGEVGELRKVVDDFIKTQTLKEAKKEEPEEEPDYFVDPKQAVNHAIDNHPAVREAQKASMAMRQQEVLGKLGAKYPDFMNTVRDPSFAEWVKGSRIRTEMFARAETQFDFDAADELLSTWQERQGKTKDVVEAANADRNRQLKAASVTTQGSTESVAKKKYRRADIIKLMQTDPDRYDAMSQEIMQAYKEGRVV